MSLIERLTEEQETRLSIVREEWRAIGLSTEPVDVNAARAAIKTLYTESGLESPQVLVLPSPASALLARGILISLLQNRDRPVGQLWDQLGGWLKSQLRDQLRDQLEDQFWNQLRDQLGGRLIRDLLGEQLWGQLGGQLRDRLWNQLRDQLRGRLIRNHLRDRLVGQLGEQLWDQLRNQIRDQLWDQGQLGGRLIRDRLRDRLEDQLEDQLRGQDLYETPLFVGGQDGYWLAFYSFVQELGVTYSADTAARFSAYQTYARSCGWMFAYNSIAFASDRPSMLGFDAQRRLHSSTGPAIRFRDGYSLFAWHGYRIPDWVIEEKHKLNPKVIAGEKNAELRRVMFEIYGADRFIAETGAKLLTEDTNLGNPRRLYEAEIGSDRVRVLHVINHSLEPDGSRREFWLTMPGEVTTPHEAVAFSFGFRPEHYSEACAT